jgi:hypothetical protein
MKSLLQTIAVFAGLLTIVFLGLGIRFYATSGMHKDLDEAKEYLEEIQEDDEKF